MGFFSSRKLDDDAFDDKASVSRVIRSRFVRAHISDVRPLTRSFALYPLFTAIVWQGQGQDA